MKQDLKHYFIVGGILCAIGASSALLIGLTNVLTKDAIANNAATKEAQGLKNIFPQEDVEFGERVDFKGNSDPEMKEISKNHPYLLSYWNPIKKGETEDNTYGYIFKTTGADANNYGQVTMLVGINIDRSIGQISIIENTESYATTVQKDYVDKVNDGSIKLEDVACGATFGAKLIKAMCEQARDCVEVLEAQGGQK